MYARTSNMCVHRYTRKETHALLFVRTTLPWTSSPTTSPRRSGCTLADRSSATNHPHVPVDGLGARLTEAHAQDEAKSVMEIWPEKR